MILAPVEPEAALRMQHVAAILALRLSGDMEGAKTLSEMVADDLGDNPYLAIRAYDDVFLSMCALADEYVGEGFAIYALQHMTHGLSLYLSQMEDPMADNDKYAGKDEDELARRVHGGDDDAREPLAEERKRIRGDEIRKRFHEENEALKDALGIEPQPEWDDDEDEER
jgi:hypothetical protein